MKRPVFPALPALSTLLFAALLLGGCQSLSPRISNVIAPRIDTTPVAMNERRLNLPEGWQHGAFMEIFVRAYQDSDGDGIGDLRGLTSRLDYLKDLGIRGIWLMPITASSDRDHGYATTDFRALEPQYGNWKDFDRFIAEANARGIGVIVDYVINHASAEHPAFVDARRRASSPWRDWFVWADEAPSKEWNIWDKYPWYHTKAKPWLWRGEVKDMPLAAEGSRGFYFGTFGPHMPDFNLRNPKVWQYHEDSLRFWLNRGLAGFRLDAVPHMVENNAKDWNDQPESRALTKRLQDLVKSYDKGWTVCEATAEPPVYARAEVCGAAFAFGYVHHFVEAARGKAESVQKVAEYYLSAPHTLSTFVSNHDWFAGQRLWDQVGGNVPMYKLVAASYLLQPGTPFIYYGEEVGQPGVAGVTGDAQIRGPMSWAPDARGGGFTQGTPFRPVAPLIERNNAETQRRDPASLHAFYRTMIGLRNQYPSIARGSYEAARAEGLVATWQRKWRGEHTVVAINYGTTAASLRVGQLPAGARLASAFPQGQRLQAGADGAVSINVPAQSVQVYVVNP